MADESPEPEAAPETAVHAAAEFTGPPAFTASAPAASASSGGGLLEGSFSPGAAGSSAAMPGAGTRPEIAIGGAFAGGLVVAMLLKRLGS